jgi:hypothetical protein
MESNSYLDGVVEQDSVSHEDNEDDFILEEIGDCLDDQQGEPIVILEPKKGMMLDSEDDAVRFYKGYAKKKGFGVAKF